VDRYVWYSLFLYFGYKDRRVGSHELAKGWVASLMLRLDAIVYEDVTGLVKK
jgi:hypothetical protein